MTATKSQRRQRIALACDEAERTGQWDAVFCRAECAARSFIERRSLAAYIERRRREALRLQERRQLRKWAQG